MSEPITPRDVLQSVASAIPQDLRGDIIIVSSLAATYPIAVLRVRQLLAGSTNCRTGAVDPSRPVGKIK